MIFFTEILSIEFQGTASSKIISVLEKQSFYSYLDKVIGEINRLLSQPNSKQNQFHKIASLGASVLVKINETFRNKTINSKDQSEIEHILGCIFKRLIIFILDKFEPQDRPLILEYLKDEIDLQCRLNDYKINELNKLINFESLAIDIMIEFTPTTKESAIVVPHFLLRGYFKENQNIFIENIQKLECFNGDSFAELFLKPRGKLNLEFNSNNVSLTRQFLTWLNTSSIVRSTPSNFKFYDILRFHTVNFDLIVPNDKKVKQVMDGARRLVTWEDNKAIFENLFKQK